MLSRIACTSLLATKLTYFSFAATAVISLGAVWFIYKKMMAVRKKVIIGMRNDLRAKNVPTSAPPSGSGFAQADPDKRSWKNPFARQAVTEATA